MDTIRFKKDFEKYKKGDVLIAGSFLGCMLVDKKVAKWVTDEKVKAK